MSMPFTVKEIVDFCYGKFKNHDYNETARVIIEANRRGKLHVVSSDDNRLIGVCIVTQYHATKTLFMHQIVGVENAFVTFIYECFRRFPDYQLKGKRKGKTLTYNKRNLWVMIRRQLMNQRKQCSKP